MAPQRVAMLPVDCPMLDTDELDAHLGRSPRTALIVPDRHGTGTNALVLNPPDLFRPGLRPGQLRQAREPGRGRPASSFALEAGRVPGDSTSTRPRTTSLLRDRLLLDPQPAPRTAKVLWELGDRAQQAAA